MHPRADEHPVSLVEVDGRVVRVDAVQGEREDARAPRRVLGTEEVEPSLAPEALADPAVQGEVVGADLVQPDPVEEP